MARHGVWPIVRQALLMARLKLRCCPPEAPAARLKSAAARLQARPARRHVSPARTIASLSNVFISAESLPKTARLAAFQLAILAAPYM